MTPDQSKHAIEQLTVNEVFALADWLDDYTNRRWNKQIADDLGAGRLDQLLSEADNAIKQGKTFPL